jgi:hypothetical protein
MLDAKQSNPKRHSYLARDENFVQAIHGLLNRLNEGNANNADNAINANNAVRVRMNGLLDAWTIGILLRQSYGGQVGAIALPEEHGSGDGSLTRGW